MNFRTTHGFFRRPPQLTLAFLTLIALSAPFSALGAQPRDLQEEERRIAAELRCVVCQNLSVADSPSEMAQQMRAIILEQLQEGKTAAEIKDYFVSKYGAWVLLSPPAQGFGLLVWLLPFAALGTGSLVAVYLIRRWALSRKESRERDAQTGLIERLRQETLPERTPLGEDSGKSLRSALMSERARLRSEARELEFDCEAGKLSDADYGDLQGDVELQLSAVEKELQALPPQVSENEPGFAGEDSAPRGKAEPNAKQAGMRVWRLSLAGLLLVVLGIALGIILTNSLKPRSSEQESMTGDFLTGTRSQDAPSLLAQGRAAFERREWGAAIEAFRGALKTDPNEPEANSYMGLILAEAGHTEGALTAFDRVLASHPDFPIALWGKGMLLYQVKKDYAGARDILERLAGLIPPGDERDAVAKILVEVRSLAAGDKPSGVPQPQAAAKDIRGTVVLGSPSHSPGPESAVLFIIARSADSSGPPLAVKKVERPVFPVQYVLGVNDSMMPGRSLEGRVFVSARLDQDGNPMTRSADDWAGEYGRNPVEIGARGVDITIKRSTQP